MSTFSTRLWRIDAVGMPIAFTTAGVSRPRPPATFVSPKVANWRLNTTASGFALRIARASDITLVTLLNVQLTREVTPSIGVGGPDSVASANRTTSAMSSFSANALTTCQPNSFTGCVCEVARSISGMGHSAQNDR